MSKMKFFRKVVFVVATALLFVIISPKVSAISSQEIFKRILVNNFEFCYQAALTTDMSYEGYKNFDSLMNEGFNSSVTIDQIRNVVVVPTGLGNSMSSRLGEGFRLEGASVTSCYALFNGNNNNNGKKGLVGNMSGLFQFYKTAENTPPNSDYGTTPSVNSVNTFMGTTLKYEIKTDDVSKTDYCYEIHIAETGSTSNEDKVIGKYCRSEDNYPVDNKSIKWEIYDSAYEIRGGYTQDEDDLGNSVGKPYFNVRLTTKDKSCLRYDWWPQGSDDPTDTTNVQCVRHTANRAGGGETIPLELPKVGKEYNFVNEDEGGRIFGFGNNKFYVKITTEKSTGDGSVKTTYKKDSNKWTGSLSTITGDAFKGYVAFSDADKYDFYLQYLATNYGGGKVSVNSQTCQEDKPSKLADSENNKYYIWAKGNGWCEAKLSLEAIKSPKTLTVFSEKERIRLDSLVKNVSELIELMGKLDYSNPDEFVGVDSYGTPDNPDDPVTPPGDGGDGETDICYANSGALGWIVCPIITALHGIGNKMWNQIETYHMVVPASEVFKSGGGVDKGWGLVRDIANVLFVILFLVVIFSQLTGVGIDNYGIKKILPRLIVVAILVNLSYIICELAVDLSNILGMGLNNMLSNLAGNLATAGDGASTGGQVAAWTLTGIFAVGGTFLWGLLNAGSAVGALIWIGLAVLGIAIMIIVAMLFLYLTLVVREAGIVLSIVLAPVAIVCYALPNTEKLGKKWFDLFKALLLVYPICGAMIGGGQLAGSILASIDNEGMKLAAAIVQVAPFFFIPMVLRNSLSLMGNVGAKLSSLGRSWGRKASGFAQNTIKSTNRYKDFTQYQQSQAAARRAQRVQARLRERQEAGETLSERQLNRLRKADDTMIEYEKAQRADRASGRGSNYEARMAAIADNERSQRIKERETLMATDNNYRQMTDVDLRTAWNNMANDANADSEEFQALTGYYVSRYGAAAVNQIARSMGNWNVTGNGAQNVAHRNRVQDLRQVRSDDKDFAALLRNKAPDADSMVADGARVGDSYANLEHFTNNQITATAIKDWVGASTATLQRSVGAQRTEGDNAGEYVITTRQLQEMLTSTDPAIQSGLRSEDGKYEQVAGEYYNRTHGTNLDRREAARLYDQEQRDNAAMAQNRQNQMSSNVERIANSLEGMGGNRFDVPHRNGGGAPTPPTPPVDPRDAIPRNYGDSPDAGTDAGAGADNNYE